MIVLIPCVSIQAKNEINSLVSKLEEAQSNKAIVEKVLQEKNAKANRLQEEVMVLKERLSNAKTVHTREMETQKQKVSFYPLCFSRNITYFEIKHNAFQT